MGMPILAWASGPPYAREGGGRMERSTSQGPGTRKGSGAGELEAPVGQPQGPCPLGRAGAGMWRPLSSHFLCPRAMLPLTGWGRVTGLGKGPRAGAGHQADRPGGAQAVVRVPTAPGDAAGSCWLMRGPGWGAACPGDLLSQDRSRRPPCAAGLGTLRPKGGLSHGRSSRVPSDPTCSALSCDC